MAVSELPKRPAVAAYAGPVRVLMLCYEYPPLGGGTAAACSYLLAELALTDEVEVDLVTSGTQPQVERVDIAPHVRIHRLPVAKTDARFWRARELAEWLWRGLPYAGALARRQHFDIAHCWAGWPSGMIGWWLRARQPYIVSLRGSDVPGYIAHVSALSADLRALAWRTEPGLAIDVIPNGVDTRQFTLAGRGERNDILFAGRLILRKGVAHLLEAYAALGDLPQRPRLLIAGEGPERGARELLQDNGLVVPPGDSVALRDALARYLTDALLCAGIRFAAAGRA